VNFTTEKAESDSFRLTGGKMIEQIIVENAEQPRANQKTKSYSPLRTLSPLRKTQRKIISLARMLAKISSICMLAMQSA
jgi:hypothetical protein